MTSAKENLYLFVDGLRDFFHLSEQDTPINTVEFCGSLPSIDVTLHSFQTSGFCAAALPGDTVNTIILNANRNVSERNFDCAHEMIHLTKHRDRGIPCFHCFDQVKPLQDSYLEWEANEGAAEFIVPYRSFLPLVKESIVTIQSWQDIDLLKLNLARRFQVTEAVISIRFESLKYEFFQYLNGIPLERLEFLSHSQQKAAGIQVSSLNDLENRLLRPCFSFDLGISAEKASKTGCLSVPFGKQNLHF